MKITLEPTPEFVTIDGMSLRVWRGTTDTGAPCEAFIRGIGVAASREAELEGLQPEEVPREIAGRTLPSLL